MYYRKVESDNYVYWMKSGLQSVVGLAVRRTIVAQQSRPLPRIGLKYLNHLNGFHLCFGFIPQSIVYIFIAANLLVDYSVGQHSNILIDAALEPKFSVF